MMLSGGVVVLEDDVLGAHRVGEEHDHHHDRRDRVEDLERQVVAGLHRDLVVGAPPVADHDVEDQPPHDDAGDQRRDPRALPQVEDVLALLGRRVGHREPLASVARSNHSPGAPLRRAVRPNARRAADPRKSPSRPTPRTLLSLAQPPLVRSRPGGVPRTGSFRSVYLDTASSEPLHPAARDAMLAALDQGYADPRRLHAPARNARLILDNAREAVAEALGVRRDEVSFTSSGTDAVHRGLLGLRRLPAASRGALRGRALRGAARRWPGGADVRGRGRSAVDRAAAGRPVERAWATPDVGRAPVAPTTRSAPSSRSPRPRLRRRTALHGRLRLDGPAPAARAAGRWPPARRTSGAARPASACCWSARAAPWRNPFPDDDRVDERVSGFENVPAVAGRRRRAPGRGRRARRGQRPPARPRRPDPGAGSPRSPTPRWSATRSTGSPTWSRSRSSTSTARRSSTRSTAAASRSPAARPAPPPPSSPATCWRRWARSPTATSGSR